MYEYLIYYRIEDLSELEQLTGDEKFLEGKICIARYGKIYRGNKVQNCQNKGSIGMCFLYNTRTTTNLV